jgi:pyruvate dehydrogenase (quinone)
VLPSDADLDRAAEVLNAGERVAMLVGRGALAASSEVARRLLGTKPSWTLMQETR